MCRLSYNPWRYFDDAAAKELESCSFLEVTASKSKGSIIFRDLFWKIFKEKNYQLPPPELQNHIFAFELCSSVQNLSISKGKFTDGEKENLLLFSARNMDTLKVSCEAAITFI